MCLVSASATVIYRQPCDVWQIGAIVNQSITHAWAPLSITGHTTGLYATATVACVSVSLPVSGLVCHLMSSCYMVCVCLTGVLFYLAGFGVSGGLVCWAA